MSSESEEKKERKKEKKKRKERKEEKKSFLVWSWKCERAAEKGLLQMRGIDCCNLSCILNYRLAF